MKENIYLILVDRGADDCSTHYGYIKGTEEDADKYCDEYNAKHPNEWYELTWELLPELKDLSTDEQRGIIF